MVNKFKMIGFDLDGTLINSIDVWLDLFKRVLKNFKINAEEREIKNLFGKEYKKIVYSLAPKEKAEEIIEKIKQERKNNLFLNKFKLFPFTEKVLLNIRKKGIKIATISGNDREMNDFFINKFRLNKMVDFCICAGNVKKGKPEPDMILKVLEFFRIPKKEFIYIGDTSYDVEMGKRARVKTGVVLTGVLDEKEAEKLKPDFIFKDIRGVLKII